MHELTSMRFRGLLQRSRIRKHGIVRLLIYPLKKKHIKKITSSITTTLATLLPRLPLLLFLLMSISGWSQGQKPPKRIRIDDAHQPDVIRVPTRSAGYYVSTVGVRSRINLGPPILLPKDFGRRKPFFTNYTSKQGLPISDLACGYKDHSGNLWFGSYNRGVLRYDGNRFMELNVTTDVSDIVEDNLGTCWFGNENGLTRYDGRGVYKYVLGDPQNRMYVLDLMKDRTGRIWIGTLYNGVYSFDPKKSKDLHFTHYAPPAKRLRYNALLETSDGIIFCLLYTSPSPRD